MTVNTKENKAQLTTQALSFGMEWPTELSRKNRMQVQQTRGIDRVQAEDYLLLFIPFVFMGKRRYSTKPEMEKRKPCLTQRIINLQNVLLQGDTENREVRGDSRKNETHVEN